MKKIKITALLLSMLFTGTVSAEYQIKKFQETRNTNIIEEVNEWLKNEKVEVINTNVFALHGGWTQIFITYNSPK